MSKSQSKPSSRKTKVPMVAIVKNRMSLNLRPTPETFTLTLLPDAIVILTSCLSDAHLSTDSSARAHNIRRRAGARIQLESHCAAYLRACHIKKSRLCAKQNLLSFFHPASIYICFLIHLLSIFILAIVISFVYNLVK